MSIINVLSKNKKNIKIFHMKIIFLTAVKNCSTLHGRVFVMEIIMFHHASTPMLFRPNQTPFLSHLSHYENTPMQYTAIFQDCKSYNFQIKNVIFFIFAQNIDCGYTLEPPHLGGSNEYPQSIF